MHYKCVHNALQCVIYVHVSKCIIETGLIEGVTLICFFNVNIQNNLAGYRISLQVTESSIKLEQVTDVLFVKREILIVKDNFNLFILSGKYFG